LGSFTEKLQSGIIYFCQSGFFAGKKKKKLGFFFYYPSPSFSSFFCSKSLGKLGIPGKNHWSPLQGEGEKIQKITWFFFYHDGVFSPNPVFLGLLPCGIKTLIFLPGKTKKKPIRKKLKNFFFFPWKSCF